MNNMEYGKIIQSCFDEICKCDDFGDAMTVVDLIVAHMLNSVSTSPEEFATALGKHVSHVIAVGALMQDEEK